MDTNRPKRGLGALLAATTHLATKPAAVAPGSTHSAASTQTPSPEAVTSSVTVADVPLTAIRPNPSQPRTYFNPEALAELAASIRARGLIQPIVVRQLRPNEQSDTHRYELIAGERRWRAAQLADMTLIPVVIKQVFEERDILLLSLVENLQRDDLNPIEEAIAYDRLSKLFSLTHEQIADGVGKSRATVTNMIRLLELPSPVQDAMKSRKLSVGHAKVILSIPDPQLQLRYSAKTQAENLTIKELERMLAGAPDPDLNQGEPLPSTMRDPKKKGTRNTRLTPPHIQEVEQQLREHFGSRVIVEESLRKGRIIIEFLSPEDFQRILKLMQVEE